MQRQRTLTQSRFPVRGASIAALVSALVVAIAAGCASLEERERQWIFQPSDRAWGGTASLADGMQDVWIDFDSKVSGKPARLHGLWLPADGDAGASPAALSAQPSSATLHASPSAAPLLLYLHGSRWNVSGSSPRVRRMQELGFSVLAIDYRGFGKSTPVLPSERMAYEDARVAWDWLAKTWPDRPRYIFGHSLGGAVAIDLASKVSDESGTIVEGTFTSIRDVASSFKWGWLPIGPFITQRFESVDKVGHLGAPLLVVHGEEDGLIKPELGKRLFEAASQPKAFVLVPHGSHYTTNSLGQPQYRAAIADLFGIGTAPAAHARSSSGGVASE